MNAIDPDGEAMLPLELEARGGPERSGAKTSPTGITGKTQTAREAKTMINAVRTIRRSMTPEHPPNHNLHAWSDFGKGLA
jgi:hypothetical protein